jgi:hypothetical protein
LRDSPEGELQANLWKSCWENKKGQEDKTSWRPKGGISGRKGGQQWLMLLGAKEESQKEKSKRRMVILGRPDVMDSFGAGSKVKVRHRGQSV